MSHVTNGSGQFGMAKSCDTVTAIELLLAAARVWKVRRRYWIATVVLGIFIPAWTFTRLNTWPGFVHHVTTLVVNDRDRRMVAQHIKAEERWKLMELERIYGQNECQRRGRTSNPKWAWVTAIANNQFVLPSLVLGHSLNQFSCQRKMIALVSREVSDINRDALVKVGWEVTEVEAYDCNWLDKKQGREPQNIGILGTHMRFHLWTFENYEKLVYVDGDFLLMSNIDELFEVEADFAACHCARPGMIDLCFNAGLFVMKPSKQTFNEIMEYWENRARKGRCISDQLLFWYFFGRSNRWKPLPYAYNVRRMIYWPMKAYHFAGTIFYNKPWEYCPYPTRQKAASFNGPITVVDDAFMLWWKIFYQMEEKYSLNDWWKQFQETVLKSDIKDCSDFNLEAMQLKIVI